MDQNIHFKEILKLLDEYSNRLTIYHYQYDQSAMDSWTLEIGNHRKKLRAVYNGKDMELLVYHCEIKSMLAPEEWHELGLIKKTPEINIEDSVRDILAEQFNQIS